MFEPSLKAPLNKLPEADFGSVGLPQPGQGDRITAGIGRRPCGPGPAMQAFQRHEQAVVIQPVGMFARKGR